ncbi:MAG: GDSL-type esterase/lipase family protein [Thermanaerothrix sp.]|uniref:GDSL-type esterase/lipase family protein n=1 Tax=Thermanaerothrix sp. TaxID=2972675 RepID=UPI003C7B5009
MLLNAILSTLLVITLVYLVLARMAAERLARTHHEQKCDFFAHHPVKAGDIVFLGDSITDGARWDELFPGLPVKNRGINADTTRGVLARLDSILQGQPAAIFLLIGTNDLPWFMFRSDRDILETYTAILERCRRESPNTQVFVQSILPRARGYAKRILRINAELERLAHRFSYTFVNLFPHFADANGQIRSELSNDKLHLMAIGYDLWVEQIKPLIKNLTSSTLSEFHQTKGISY